MFINIFFRLVLRVQDFGSISAKNESFQGTLLASSPLTLCLWNMQIQNLKKSPLHGPWEDKRHSAWANYCKIPRKQLEKYITSERELTKQHPSQHLQEGDIGITYFHWQSFSAKDEVWFQYAKILPEMAWEPSSQKKQPRRKGAWWMSPAPAEEQQRMHNPYGLMYMKLELFPLGRTFASGLCIFRFVLTKNWQT